MAGTADTSATAAADTRTGTPTTQRAYTLRLHVADLCDTSWRDALWATHEAINKGAKVFGDWLLTLRGGLDYRLANAKVTVGKGKPDRDPTQEERRNRRILLALSWLSVEDEHGAPSGELRVATGRDQPTERRKKVIQALHDILRRRGVPPSDIGGPAKNSEDQPGTWVGDCAPSLSAAIREDAVWVNRSALFEKRCSTLPNLDRAYAAQAIFTFLGPEPDYFQLPGTEDELGGSSTQEPEFRTLARQWVSTNLGTGRKSDTAQIASALKRLASIDISSLADSPKTDVLAHLTKILIGTQSNGSEDTLRRAIGWSTGRASKGRLAVQNLPDPPSLSDLQILQGKLAEEARDKVAKSGTRDVPEWMPRLQELIERNAGVPFVSKRNLIGEFSVMLDHAARRVSIAHSWVKRAEASRAQFEEDSRRINPVPQDVHAWLDTFLEERARNVNAGDSYSIRKRALGGKHAKAWKAVVAAWQTCTTEEERRQAVGRVQSDWDDDEKFGHSQLFTDLADDEAKPVWENGPEALIDYVSSRNAEARMRRFKVPAYRHPDPLAHPVFGDFGKSRWDIRFAVHETAKAAAKKSRNKKVDDDWLRDLHGLRMGLWNGRGVQHVDLRWSSKRLTTDLALRDDDHGDQHDVARADRLGRAAAGLSPEQAARVAGLFELKDWNGRLQAPRVQLNAIAARVAKHGWDAVARRMRDNLNWLVTFSAKLECRGPFTSYAARHSIKPNRKGHAKLILSRLPGLRVLSVDLGHRFAAACAVWETLPPEDFQREIAGREVVGGGSDHADMFLHARHTDAQGKQRTTIYRRIGADTLADGQPHAAPWARLDRQFLIKLQGEEKPPRAASSDEIDYVRRLDADLGRARDEHNPLPRRVDELMAEAVRSVRLALRHHGDAARIAYAFKPDGALHTLGGGSQVHTTESRTKAVRDALVRWHERATSTRWKDDWASQHWDEHIKLHLSGELPKRAEDVTRAERKKQLQSLESALEPIAEKLAKAQSRLGELHKLWSDRWITDDATWKPRLRRLRDWLLPRGLRQRPDDTPQQAADRKARRDAARNVGGLSLTRIATIRGLYQLQKAYAMRPAPDDPRKNIAAKNDHRYDEFGRFILRVVERLREQRVKQLASRIVEAALGVGRMKPANGRDRKRPQAPKDEPCHSVVIESLRNYRPDELQTRRENRALMNWSAGKVRKYLEEGCHLHGLYLREVMPNYTSRQCSRTGLPGLRCDDVPVHEFRTSPWWRKAVNAARKRADDGGQDSYDRLLADLDNKLSGKNGNAAPITIRLPRNGGDLFVAAGTGNGAAALQADLNAAANIGLRALLDPDFPGKWWYVPCDTKDYKPARDKVAGAVCVNSDAALADVSAHGKGKHREFVNLWRDPSTAEIARRKDDWQPTPAYWNNVRAQVIARLRQLAALDVPLESNQPP